jgi:hypothetical protein
MFKGANMKAHYEFGNDLLMKMCFEHKTIMKTDHGIKNTKIVFLSSKL